MMMIIIIIYIYGGFQKWGYLQIDGSQAKIPLKWMIGGSPISGTPPIIHGWRPVPMNKNNGHLQDAELNVPRKERIRPAVWKWSFFSWIYHGYVDVYIYIYICAVYIYICIYVVINWIMDLLRICHGYLLDIFTDYTFVYIYLYLYSSKIPSETVFGGGFWASNHLFWSLLGALGIHNIKC